MRTQSESSVRTQVYSRLSAGLEDEQKLLEHSPTPVYMEHREDTRKVYKEAAVGEITHHNGQCLVMVV